MPSFNFVNRKPIMKNLITIAIVLASAFSVVNAFVDSAKKVVNTAHVSREAAIEAASK